MSRSLDAVLVPIVLALDDHVGLGLWAPPWVGSDGEPVEGFLGEADSVYAFSTADELAQFLHAHPIGEFSDHPAWKSLCRQPADELRAEADDYVDFEEVYALMSGEPTAAACQRLSKIVQIATAIGDCCGDTELASVLDREPYQTAVRGSAWFVGVPGLRRWDDVSREVAASWSWVLERLEQRIRWQGDGNDVDANALREPGARRSPWIGAGSAEPLYNAMPPAASPAVFGELPSRWPTVIVTAIFGLFGLIPAALATSEARQIGQPTGRYWAAFVWTLVVEIALGLVLFLVVAGAVVSAGS